MQKPYIYVVKDKQTNYFKVGLSNNVLKRLLNYRTLVLDLQILKLYEIKEELDLRQIEKNVFDFIVKNGLKKKRELFIFQTQQELEQILDNLDDYMEQFCLKQVEQIDLIE